MVRLEVSATVLNEKSLVRNATSSTANATVRIPASAYTERRPDSENSTRPLRTPYSDAPMPYTQTASETSRHAKPRIAISAQPPSRSCTAVAPGTQSFCFSLGGAVLYLDGHFVISELRSPTNVEPCFSTPTITSRPSRNGSGTVPV